jgi:cytochrome P450
LMQPAFHRERVQGVGSQIVTSAAGLLDEWHRRADSDDIVDVQKESLAVALRVASSVLFGLDADDDVERLGRAFEAMVEALSEYVFLPLPPLGVPTPRNRRIRGTVRRLDMLVSDLVQTRRRQPRSGDLLALLLTARDEDGQGMDDAQLHDEIVTLLFAGHETSANTLTWACYELSRHPEIEERLWREVHSVLRGHQPTVAHIPQLTYTRMVVDEVLRLYPPAPFVARRVVRDSTISGYLMPANHVVSVNICASHRHPRYWNRPEVFNPDRFSPDHPDPGVRHAYFPFGAGPHLCIGNGLALMEIPLILAMIVQRYRLRPISPVPVKPTMKLTLRPPDGLPLRIEHRDTGPARPDPGSSAPATVGR